MANNYDQNRGDRETEQLRKLFVGGLSPNIGDDELRQHFEQWGELVDVVVMKDRVSGRSRGFGFVTYKEEDSVDRAQSNRPHVLDGKEVETKRAMPRGEATREESSMRVDKLFVGGLKPEITKEQLQEYFSAFGDVVSAEIATSRETGKPRGFAFVSFSDPDSVDKAILRKPHDIGNSQQVDCKRALSREQMAQIKAQQMQFGGYGRGGFMGGGGRGGFMGGGRGGFMGGGRGGYGYEDQGGYGGGYDDGYGGGYAGNGEGYENGGFGSYDNQGYGGGPAKGSGGFGGGPQRFQPYGGMRGGPMGGRGGRDGGRGMGGGFRGGRGGRGGYDY